MWGECVNSPLNSNWKLGRTVRVNFGVFKSSIFIRRLHIEVILWGGEEEFSSAWKLAFASIQLAQGG